MFPVYRNRVAVHLAPAGATVTVTPRGWRPRPGGAVAVPVAAVSGVAWQDSLAALRAWLERAAPAPADLRITLADSLVRYALIPWSDEVQNSGERMALARIRFDALYGKPCADWLIQSDLRDYRQAGIACALDPAMKAALHELAAAHGLRLTSLQPRFMDVFNGAARHDIARDALLVVAEPGHCVLASRKDGGWHSIRAARVEAGRASLAQLIPRELLLQGLDSEVPVLFHADDAADVDIPRLRQMVKLTLLGRHQADAAVDGGVAGGQI